MNRFLTTLFALFFAATLLSACGGGGGGSADATRPTASAVNPASNATGVDPNTAVTAVFSETVSGVDGTTFTLQDAAGTFVTGSAVSSGLTATFTPSAALACSTTYTVLLTSGIKDIAGNPLAAASWSFTTRDVSSWAYLDSTTVNGLNKDPNQLATGNPSLIMFDSRLYATWIERYSSWYQIRVSVYNGNDDAPSWSFVDGNGANGINKDGTKTALDPQLIVFNSKLYAGWDENNGTTSQIRVVVYNGNDAGPSWTFVDGNGAYGINKNSGQNAYYPRFAVLGSKLYAAWLEWNGTANQVRAAVYNGNDTAPLWAFVDGNSMTGLNKNSTRETNNPRLMVFGSRLYAAWEESNGTATQIRVAVYNGNDGAPSWAFVDGNGVNGINKDPAKSASYPRLAALGSKLYAVWSETDGTAYQIRAAVYNGDDAAPAWTFVDGNGTTGINRDSTISSILPSLTVLGSKLYASWTEDMLFQIRVAAYNGNDAAPSWTFVDGNGVNGINKDPSRNASSSEIIVAGRKLYATWMEMNGMGNEVRVAVGR